MDFLSRYLDTRLVWAFWITASIVTTALLLQGELIFPMHVLFVHLLVAQTVQLILYGTDWRTWLTYHLLRPYEIWQSIDISSLVCSFLMAPILINAYKTIALSNDLPNLILVLTLDWRLADLFDKLIERKLRASDFARYLVFASGLYLVCVCNFRLRFIPWKFSMHFLVFTGLAQVVSHWKINLSKPYLKPAAENDQALPRYWVVCSLTVVGFLLVVQPELMPPNRSPSSVSTIVTALVNVIATSSLFALSPAFQELESTQPLSVVEKYSPRVEEALLRLAVAGYVIASDSLLSSRPLNISFWQYLGYVMAALAFLTWEETTLNVHWLGRPSTKLVHGQESKGGVLAFLILAGGAWSFALLNSLTVIPAQLEYISLSLAPSPFPASEFEIVIARYAEPAVEVAQTLDSLLAAEGVRALHARVTIYNKNDDTSEFEKDLLANLASEVDVSCYALENTGREGDTYLHHIVAGWDNLATHTLFAQAGFENLPMAVKWIENFFVPETGFLQLSYEGRMCAACEHCGSWTDDPAVISDLYGLTNPGRQCRNLVWTFRGQFIVSGARIRANGKGVYEDLLRKLRDPENEMHSPQYTESIWHSAESDSLNHPVFGFTLERFWGILMQCSEPRVGYWSPSQLAVSVRPKWLAGRFSYDDSQCLDRPRGE